MLFELHAFLAYAIIYGGGLAKLIGLLSHHSWPVLHATSDGVPHVVYLWLKVWLQSPLRNLQVLSLLALLIGAACVHQTIGVQGPSEQVGPIGFVVRRRAESFRFLLSEHGVVHEGILDAFLILEHRAMISLNKPLPLVVE